MDVGIKEDTYDGGLDASFGGGDDDGARGDVEIRGFNWVGCWRMYGGGGGPSGRSANGRIGREERKGSYWGLLAKKLEGVAVWENDKNEGMCGGCGSAWLKLGAEVLVLTIGGR